MNSCLFKNKTKNMIATVFIAIYIVETVVLNNYNFSRLFSVVYFAFSLAAPVCILVYLLTLQKEYPLKKLLFPIAFGIITVLRVVLLVQMCSNIPLYIEASVPFSLFVIPVISFFAIVACFIGTLFDFKYAVCLKIGTLTHIAVSVISLIVSFIQVGGMSYFDTVPDLISAINISELISFTVSILFYVGIFVLTTNKKTQEVV